MEKTCSCNISKQKKTTTTFEPSTSAVNVIIAATHSQKSLSYLASAHFFKQHRVQFRRKGRLTSFLFFNPHFLLLVTAVVAHWHRWCVAPSKGFKKWNTIRKARGSVRNRELFLDLTFSVSRTERAPIKNLASNSQKQKQAPDRFLNGKEQQNSNEVKERGRSQ